MGRLSATTAPAVQRIAANRPFGSCGGSRARRRNGNVSENPGRSEALGDAERSAA